MAVGVVDFLEMVHIEGHQRERHLLSIGIGELALHAVSEVLLVEDLGQVVAQGRFVHLALEGFIQAVMVGELQHRPGTDEDLVPILQLLAFDA